MENDNQLARWLAGEMSGQELEALENSPEYPTLLKIRENFSRLQKPKFDSDAILQQVLRHKKNAANVIPIYRRIWVPIAAMVVILLGLAMTFLTPKSETAKFGERHAFVLPDKSEVILNSGSTVSYRSWNWSGNREISLDGEAYFKVAKGKTFVVETDLGTVTVLGTQFNVKARENRFDVVCYEGRVRVGHQSQVVVLTPGQYISFVKGSKSHVETVIVDRPQWLEHEMLFSKENLSGVIAEIERQYNVDIRASMHSEQLFSGSLPGNNLDAALQILSVTYHLDIDRNASTIIMTPVNAGP